MHSSGTNHDAVRLDQVGKRYGSVQAVENLTLSVPRGSIYGFIGPNGSGKTTTIRMILHIILPDLGRIEVLGEHNIRAANDRIGYLPEERGLYKKMTVQRVLSYFAALKGMPRDAARRAIGSWLERMGLSAWANSKIETLSKGMAQKIQFVSSVITKPDLLILDEPFSGLDPVNLEVIRSAIIDLRRAGTTVIFSTHDMNTAEQMCDFIFMIYRGRKVLDGTLASIQSEYGADTIRVRLEGGGEFLGELPGVSDLRDLGQCQELRFRGDSQKLLQEIAARARVSLFEVARPSLHDIFVRIAQPERSENGENLEHHSH